MVQLLPNQVYYNDILLENWKWKGRLVYCIGIYLKYLYTIRHFMKEIYRYMIITWILIAIVSFLGFYLVGVNEITVSIVGGLFGGWGVLTLDKIYNKTF